VKPRLLAREYLVASHGKHTLAEQAEVLGVVPSRVAHMRRKLYTAGTLARVRPVVTPRTYTEAEIAQVVQQLRAGRTLRQIADAGGYAYAALQSALRRRNIHASDEQLRGGAMSLRETARLMGVSVSAVRIWTDARLLATAPIGRARPDGRRDPRVRMGHLIAFLSERAVWMSYDPAQIADAAVRGAATRARAACPGRWWPTRELSAALHFTPSAIQVWQDRGWPGAGWEWTRWGTALYLWVPAGEALPRPPGRA
jgi:hypothetical protein